MTARRLVLALLAARVGPSVSGAVHASTPRFFLAAVKCVSAGDTLVAVKGTRVRLLGIGAPEIPHGKKPGQPSGEEARDYLDHHIGGKTVNLDADGPDQDKRMLAVVWDDPVNVNLLMGAMGDAEVYHGARCQVYCRELEQAEARAHRDRVGR